jgi:hypothetical protein
MPRQKVKTDRCQQLAKRWASNVDPTQGGAAHGSLVAGIGYGGFPSVPGRIWTSRGHTHTQWQRLGGESGIHIPTIPLYILKVKTTNKCFTRSCVKAPPSVSVPRSYQHQHSHFRLVSQSCTFPSIPRNSSGDHNLQRQGNLLRQQLHGAL